MSRQEPSDAFNPYHMWLGIPQHKCPPTFYELLGISLNEDDRFVIESAAERQRSHVEQYLGTKWNKLANQLIGQIDEAEITLLSPDLRREYDRKVNLFTKRRKSRQVDPTGTASSLMPGGVRSVGEGSGLAREYAGIVSVLAIAFFAMAASTFFLPWGKLIPDAGPVAQDNEPAPEGEEKLSEVPPATAETTPAAMPEEKPTEPVLGLGMQFKRVPAGTFNMGAENTNRGSTRPVHAVTISKPFDLGIYEVTQKQYEEVMGINPSV